MAYNEILADRIREILADVPRVQEKKMFRGVTFMVNKKMCVCVSLDRMMCRIDPEIHESLVEMDGCRTVNMRGSNLKGWVYVDEGVIRTEKSLKYWVALALDFNKRAKASVKTKAKGKPNAKRKKLNAKSDKVFVKKAPVKKTKSKK